MLCFFADRRLVDDFRRALDFFRVVFGLDFDMFIPGMFCMSWPCGPALPLDESINPVMITVLSPINLTDVPKLKPFIIPPVVLLPFKTK